MSDNQEIPVADAVNINFTPGGAQIEFSYMLRTTKTLRQLPITRVGMSRQALKELAKSIEAQLSKSKERIE